MAIRFRLGSWVPDGRWRTRSSKHFQLKAMKMHSLGAVPLQNGTSAISVLDTEHKRNPAKESYRKSLESTLTIIVVGPTGNLARKRIFPALFALFCNSYLPRNCIIFGYARSRMTDQELRNMISEALTCGVYVKKDKCDEQMSKFLKCCFYHSGQYSSEEHFLELNNKLEDKEMTALFAMETPVTLCSEDVRNEKVKLLHSMTPIKLKDVVVGQYKSKSNDGVAYPAYTDASAVSNYNLSPTFVAVTHFVNNARWEGAPFLIVASKALHSHPAEIREQFTHVPGNICNQRLGTDLDLATNELVLRDQPDQAIYLKINNKVYSLGMKFDCSDVNLLYKSRRHPNVTPDSYERMLLDAIEGKQRFFIRSDELVADWAVFTPLMKELEEEKIVPELYIYVSGGPAGFLCLATEHNIRWGDFGYED